MDGRTRRALPGMIAKLDAMAKKEKNIEIFALIDSAASSLYEAFRDAGGNPAELEAPQPLTAEVSTAPSPEGVGQEGVAEASTTQGDA